MPASAEPSTLKTPTGIQPAPAFPAGSRAWKAKTRQPYTMAL